MNARELADYVEDMEPYLFKDAPVLKAVATTLRELQDKHESLCVATRNLRDLCDDWEGVDRNAKRFAEIEAHNNALAKVEKFLSRSVRK